MVDFSRQGVKEPLAFKARVVQFQFEKGRIPAIKVNDGVYKTNCFMCHGGCGVLVHLQHGKAVKIEGDPKSPLNRGKLCAKGLASLEHLYNPDRLKYPMKRVGGRGENQWQRISWDEALNTICRRLEEIKGLYGPEAVAIGSGTARHPVHFIARFANAFGTPNRCTPGAAQCFVPRVSVSKMTFGDFIISDHYGDIPPRCVLVWGHNPAITGPDGEIAVRFLDSINSGAKLIVVDPRLSETAARANTWLQIRPGADAALALAMLNVLITENLYDRNFVNNWTVGFDRLAERVERYTPKWAEEVTWIPSSKIQEAAREFAISKPACIEWGVSLEHTPNSIQSLRAVALLPAITGNIDVPGGNTFGMHALRPFPYNFELLPPNITEKRLGENKYKLLSGKEAMVYPYAHTPAVFEAMRTGEPYPIKAFLVFGNNTLLTYANSKKVYEALQNLDFMVVADLYMTPTAQLADIVLPAASWLECNEVWGYPYIADNIILTQQELVQTGECRPDEEIVTELARLLHLKSGTELPEEVFNYRLEPLGITFDELKEKGWVSVPVTYRKYEKKGFNTPSGKVELYSSIMERLGYDPLPYYMEPPESPYSTPHLLDQYPLILTTGGRSPVYFHSEYRQLSSLRQIHPDPIIDINPGTAKRLNISDGDWVWIETLRGKIRQKANLTYGIDPRVVHIQHGWWFPEKPGPEHGVWESNANVLTNDQPPYDPVIGTYQLRGLLCRVYSTE